MISDAQPLSSSQNQVALDCIECPAAEVMNALSAQTGIPIYLAGALQSLTLSVYGLAGFEDHLRAMAVTLGADAYQQGNAWVLEQGTPGDAAIIRDYGLTQGQKLGNGYTLISAPGSRGQLLKRHDFRKRYFYVDVAVVSGLAEAELSLGMDMSASLGAEATALIASVGVEQEVEAVIDVGEARYVRKTSLQEGVIVEQDIQELRIPRSISMLLAADGRLRVDLQNDTVRGEAAGLPEIARTQYQTIAFVDERWRLIGTLTDRQTGAFLSFAEGATPNFRARTRGRMSALIARVREAEPVEGVQ